MSLVHRCDLCKKIKFNEDEMTTFGTGFYFDQENVDKRKKIMFNKQVIRVSITMSLECGETYELCDPCARKLMDKVLGKWGKK